MTEQSASLFDEHNHKQCITSAVEAANVACLEKGLRLTPVRRRVLEILLESHRSLGAYDILERLRADGLGSQPPVAYRALDFLVKNGFAHRVEKLNAFVACTLPSQEHDPAFLICRSCETVAETPAEASGGRLGDAASQVGFTIERAVHEAEGLCPKCQAAAT